MSRADDIMADFPDNDPAYNVVSGSHRDHKRLLVKILVELMNLNDREEAREKARETEVHTEAKSPAKVKFQNTPPTAA